eukprot:1141902-Rhodomonas_salina.1
MFRRTIQRAVPPSPQQHRAGDGALHAIVQTRPIKTRSTEIQDWQIQAVKQLAFDRYNIHINDIVAFNLLIAIMTVLDKLPKPRTDVVLNGTIICQRILDKGLGSRLNGILHQLDPDPCRDFIGEIPALIYPHFQNPGGSKHYDVTH